MPSDSEHGSIRPEEQSGRDTRSYDVLVAGGGPAGACTAGLLAQAGHRVLLLEREKAPRYHIGESLITAIWPTLERLGLRERLEAMGFPKKYGAKVRWGAEAETWGFRFRETGRFEYALQVRRAEFDALLLERARELGTHVIEDAMVGEPIFENERITGARFRIRGRNELLTAKARLVVDASGQGRWLGRHFDLVQRFDDLKNVAVWSYYQGCKRGDGEHTGDTIVENMLDGWLWFIPVSQETTSVGYVIPMSLFKSSGLELDQILESRIASSIEVSGMLASSRRCSGYRSESDWSYVCSRFHGSGWALVGDASAFIDPLLSTGVALAVRGARVLSDAIVAALADPRHEQAALRAYEENQRAYLKVILDFVRYFYDCTRTRAEYHRGAQKLTDPDEQNAPDFDFVQLVSGLASDTPLEIPGLSSSTR